MAHYLKVRWSDAYMYESNKGPAPGFEPEDWTFGDKSGTAYRKPYKTISGNLTDVRIKDVPKMGLQFSLSLKQGEDFFVIQLPVLTEKGAVDSYLQDLTRQLVNMKKGEFYELNPYAFKNEEKDKTYRGISVKNESGDKVDKSFSFQWKDNPDGDIPAIVWEEVVGGKVKPNFNEQTKFFYNKLEEVIAAQFPEEAKAETTSATPAKEEVEEDFSEDLPF